ncbi:MAG: ABC transporter ATP-binding protein [Desulfurococcales archaeon]|nr:ABC transporter ATP-binding protein [Desulfurococcaceae archaeon]MDT7865790.1 ABC transporter ATP-binding protein [Desulfurococcales archaeon]
MSQPILVAEALSSGYGKFQVLFDVSFRVYENEILAVVGPNGSGKSTLLKTVFGLTTIYSGSVIYRGRDITRLPPYVKARIGVAYLPQTDNVFAELTVKENLLMAAYTLEENEARDRIEEVLNLYPVLKERLSYKARSLSGGERQMLALAMTLVRRPDIIMLDEPTANLAPVVARHLLKKISMLRDEMKKTIVLVEQNARAALELGDRALLMVSGRVSYEGPSKSLLQDVELGKRYLGLR